MRDKEVHNGTESKSTWIKSRYHQRCAEKDFADYLVEDVKIRKFIKKKLYAAGVSKIAIERTAGRVKDERIYSKTRYRNR